MKFGVTTCLIVLQLFAIPTYAKRERPTLPKDTLEFLFPIDKAQFNKWEQLSRCMAERRTSDFISVLKQWREARQTMGNALGQLQGGSTKCQTARGSKPNPVINNNFRPYTNTQQSHFVQGHITNPPFDQWPDIFKTSLCGTLHIPAPWNQAIDKSFDNVQKKYIDKFNNTPQFTITAGFVRAYIIDVQKEIMQDNQYKRYQYGKMDQKDIKAQLDKLDQMLKDPNIINKIVDDEAFDEKDSDCLYEE